MVTALESVVGHAIHVWQVTDDSNLREVIPRGGVPEPRVEFRDGILEPLCKGSVVGAIDRMPGYWYEVENGEKVSSAHDYGQLIGSLLGSEVDAIEMASELADRYEEIDLLYTIAETIGKTVSLRDACKSILREICAVVGATRGSILVIDADQEFLEPVAGQGIDVSEFEPVAISDSESIAAAVFRERRLISVDPSDPNVRDHDYREQRTYKGVAYLSVPILYPEADGLPRPIGVISLTDRKGMDAFSAGHSKLVSAIANQIGATIENARLLALDKQRERVNHELEMARDLQRKLLPTFHREFVAARCEPAEFVGGDFYKIFDLPDGKTGVMLGDVSSHGFAAALVMASVLSAAGIHAEAATSPEKALGNLMGSLTDELEKTEMHFSVFYGVIDPKSETLMYANAGHPHVFLLRTGAEPARLGASTPPVGLANGAVPDGERLDWRTGRDVVLAFSDGVSDAQDEEGERFGEDAVLKVVLDSLGQHPAQIVENVYASLAEFGGSATDDQTVLVIKA
jgi:sigma-B regulation protein RsbU (phosphoserine phosphatase)